MTQEERKIINRINDYANKVMPNVDPQETPVSEQIENLKPILQTIADELNISLEDMFIKYMDLASEFAIEKNRKIKSSLDIKDMDIQF